MPSYTVVIILAIAGALCLAIVAAGARGLPGGWRWTGLQQGQDREAQREYVQELVRRRLQEYLPPQELLLRLLRERFGELPPAIVTRVESEDAEWCEEMLGRAATVTSLEELGF